MLRITPGMNKCVRIVPFLAFGAVLIYKLAVLAREIGAELLAGLEAPPVIALLVVGGLILLLGRIMAFLLYLLLPRSLTIDLSRRACTYHYGLCLRKRIPFDWITTVDLAAYQVRQNWLGFCCLSLRHGIPRLLVCGTTPQGTATADQALKAGGDLAMVLGTLLDRPVREHPDIGLRWFRESR